MKVFISFGSHRVRRKALGRLNNRADPHFSFRRSAPGGYYLVAEEDLHLLEGLKGWRKLRGPFDDVLHCVWK